MATLIIGAGLVGSQIACILVERGERPVLLDRAPQAKALGEIVDLSRVELVEGDLMGPFTLSRALLGRDITAIVHLAANPMLTVGAQRDPLAAIELNILGTTRVLEAARLHGVKRVVAASSNVLANHIGGGEAHGDASREEAFPRPLSFYATCKQAVENIGLNYARWCGVDFAAVRYGAVAGPWSGAGGGGPSNVFLAMARAAVSGQEAVVPASTLEWVYVKDAARGTVLALGAPLAEHRVFNITMGRLTRAEELAAALTAAVPGARYRIGQPSASGPAMSENLRACDLSLAKSVLGYEPQYQMADAVREVVDWLRRRAA